MSVEEYFGMPMDDIVMLIDSFTVLLSITLTYSILP
jgi:hypothetical protein